MSGKLPIDRVRAAEDAPRVYVRQRQRLGQDQAQLRDLASAHERDVVAREGAANDTDEDSATPEQNHA